MAKKSTHMRVSDEFYQLCKSRAKIFDSNQSMESRNIIKIIRHMESTLGVDFTRIPVIDNKPRINSKRKMLVFR